MQVMVLKQKLRKEFKHIVDLLDFDKKAHEIYRNWYVDGRIYYHKIIDFKKPEEGIQELRYIDALKMRYVRQQKKTKGDGNGIKINTGNHQIQWIINFQRIEEYFIYNAKTNIQQEI